MWKWIGIAALTIVVLMGTCVWVGYNQLQKVASGDSTATVVIGASPERVFASLATGDSMAAWMVTNTVRPSRPGVLQAGDTVYVVQRDTASPGMQRMDWVVQEVSVPRTLTLELRSDSLGIIRLSRRFVVEARGDSTAVLSTVVMPGGDSAMKQVAGGGGAANAMIGFTAKLMLGALRMQSQFEVGALKARIEGTELAIPQRP